MKLTQNDLARLRCWQEGECCEQDASRPDDTQHREPMLAKVCFSIVSRLARTRKTARGQLRAAAEAIRLVLAALDEIGRVP